MALNIQNFNNGAQFAPPVGPTPIGAGVPPTAGGPASPRVTNFAQNLAMDGSAIKGMGAGALGSLFGQGGPMMGAPVQGGTGYDNDRAVALLKQKIGAGKMTGDDLYAASIASAGEE